ncbi:hypothetical protein EXIGLDRAFT_722745 [Exidia glandulosa HHB12029]|uniref:Uncharacterized protein n=1 Tax=Exidia glandulosa HHB12029 TaxID=1314781 RepID=A0A165N450_EXIGL|nr:hypothetical protein EXIGLDRAFT_722745 [Exidia glandulosa HHB12029]
MSEPDPPNFLAPVVVYLPQLLQANSSRTKAQIARIIYANCALYDTDGELESVPTSDLAVNPDYEDDIEALYSEAVRQPPDAVTLLGIVQSLSGKFKAARAVPLADKSTPMKRKHEESSEDDHEAGYPSTSAPSAPILIGSPISEGRSKSSNVRTWINANGEAIGRTYVTYMPFSESPDLGRIKTNMLRGISDIISQREDYWPRWSADNWEEADPQIRQHVENLRLWTVPHSTSGTPDLMTYMLGELAALDPKADARLRDLFANDVIDWQINNASGTGKSRFLFELLSLEYGLYFTGLWQQPQDPYGSRDVQDAISLFPERNEHEAVAYFEPLAGLVNPKDPSVLTFRTTNHEIARHMFLIVILSRLIVLEAFVKKWSIRARHDGLSADDARRAGARLWCRLQIYPKLGKDKDIFNSLTTAMLRASPKSVLDQIGKLVSKLESEAYSWCFRLRFVVVDEAQRLCGLYPNAFCASDGATPRPVLRPLVLVLREVFASPQILVAGTKLGEDIVRDAIGSTIGKPNSTLRSFHDLGGGADAERITALLKRFFGEVYVARIPAPILSDVTFWLPGRYRFPALFVQHVLDRGWRPVEDLSAVLCNIVQSLSGVRLAEDFPMISNINPSPVISQRLNQVVIPEQHKELVEELKLIVLNLVTGKGFPVIKDRLEDYVTFGIGRLGKSLSLDDITPTKVDNRSPIVIDEPIVLAALVQWLNTRPENTFNDLLTRELRSSYENPKDSEKGFAWENILLFKLKQTLSVANGVPLTDVVDFKYLRPQWAGSTVQLISVMSAFSTTGAHVIASSTIDGPIVFESKLPYTTLRWFQGQDGHRVAFLKPDDDLGPDVILGLRLSTGEEVLLVLQMKHWQHSQYYQGAVRKALHKLSPEYYWKEYAQERQTLLQRMDSLPAYGPKMPERSSTVASEQPVSGPSYDGGPAKYPIVRVMCTIDGSHQHPDYKWENLGAYPIAYLSPQFLQDCTIDMPAIKQAIAVGKVMKPYKKGGTA